MRYPWSNFYPFATTLTLKIVGSLRPTFVTAWLVSLTVKLSSAFTLNNKFPSCLRKPCVRLRYFLGGYRPSKNDHLAVLSSYFWSLYVNMETEN